MSFFNKIKKIGNEVFELGKLKKDIESKKWNLITKLKNYGNKKEYPDFLQKELEEISILENKLKEVSKNFKESGKQLFNKEEQSNNKETTDNENEEVKEKNNNKEIKEETLINEKNNNEEKKKVEK